MQKLTLIASWSMVLLFAASTVFHALVLLGFIPTSIVWGGRHTTEQDIAKLELLSIFINVLLLLFSMSNLRLWLKPLPYLLNKVILVLFSLLFMLNTLGNMYAKTDIERMVFTPVTAYLALCFGTLFFTHNRKQNT